MTEWSTIIDHVRRWPRSWQAAAAVVGLVAIGYVAAAAVAIAHVLGRLPHAPVEAQATLVGGTALVLTLLAGALVMLPEEGNA